VSFAERYVLEERLGGGGMAEVFRARTVGAEGFSRPVAIKRVVEGLAEDPKFIRLFATEAKLSSRLDHPNVVKVLDFDRDDDGLPYIVMELIEGTTLDHLLETGPIPRPVAVKVAVDVLRGLGYAHELSSEEGVKGIVHRDVSPNNILISWEGTVKVSDFGIAKARAGTLVTASEMVKGKPAYMSPEQANADALDGRSDLFAVGVILWEMLAGRPLFSGGTTQETFAKLMFAEIPPPSKLKAEVPKDLDRVTMRLLAREREDRPRDARAAIAELVACRDHPADGIDALISVLAERFTEAKRKPAEGGPRPPVSVAHTQAPARRNGLILMAVVLGLGVAMVVVAAIAFGGDTTPPVRKKTALVPTAPVDAGTDRRVEYTYDSTSLRGHYAMLEALQATCRWPRYLRVVGIRDVQPDGTVSLPIVMSTRSGVVSTPLSPAPAALAQCVRVFMTKVKTVPPPDADRFDEDYGYGIVDVPEPRNDP
jgi:hypothetical protein